MFGTLVAHWRQQSIIIMSTITTMMGVKSVLLFRFSTFNSPVGGCWDVDVPPTHDPIPKHRRWVSDRKQTSPYCT